jgi:hypothetical protein
MTGLNRPVAAASCSVQHHRHCRWDKGFYAVATDCLQRDISIVFCTGPGLSQKGSLLPFFVVQK